MAIGPVCGVKGSIEKFPIQSEVGGIGQGGLKPPCWQYLHDLYPAQNAAKEAE